MKCESLNIKQENRLGAFRSLSAENLSTPDRHGLTFAAIPKSTIQTSPRRGSAMSRFFFVEFQENTIRNFNERSVVQRWQLEFRCSSQYLESSFAFRFPR